MSNTFYPTDNTSEKGMLKFLTKFFDKSTLEKLHTHAHYTDDRKNFFQTWYDNKKYIDLYPMLGNMIFFQPHTEVRCQVSSSRKAQSKSNYSYALSEEPNVSRYIYF